MKASSIVDCSNTKQLIVLLSAGLLVLAVGYWSDIKFLQKQLRQARAEKIKIDQLLQKRNQDIQKNEISAKQYLTPPDLNIIDVLNVVERVSLSSQVELQLLEPQVVKDDELFTVYRIKMETCGKYKKTIKFINQMLKQPFSTTFEELILRNNGADNQNNEIIMQTMLAVYKNKVPMENSTKDYAINLVERDVFSKIPSKKDLFLWSNQELHFIGVMKQAQNIYGFASDPLGMVHRVSVGDKIGFKREKIMKIDEHGITTAAGENSQ